MIKQFSHPESRDKGLDLASDRAGHFNGESSKAVHGSFNEATLPKHYEVARFAKILSDELDVARNENKYKNLIDNNRISHFLAHLRFDPHLNS